MDENELLTDWIAVFKRDNICKIFKTPAMSDDVAYWIKRFEDGRNHIPVSTGNVYQLRSFEIFDTNLMKTSLQAVSGGWKCNQVIEEYLTKPSGSNCKWIIEDTNNISKSILATGNLVGYNLGRLNEDLDFTAIMVLLKWFSKYKTWNELELKQPNLYNHFVDHCVPISLFTFIEKKTIDFYLNGLTTEILLESITKISS